MKKIIIFLSIVLMFVLPATIFAASHGGKFDSKYPNYYKSVRSDISTPVSNAIIKWNSTDVSLGGVPPWLVADLLIESDDYGDDNANGHTVLPCTCTYTSQVVSAVNEYYMDIEDWNAEKTQAVASHEIGHALGADHPTVKSDNMYPTDISYNIHGTYMPTTNDKDEINSIY